MRLHIGFVVALLVGGAGALGADLVTLSPQTWDAYAPQGKEADAIYGDFALANDKIVVVIGNPKRGRNANMTVREVGGAIIDLTSRRNPNDQLLAFYPGAALRQLRFAGIEVDAPEVYETGDMQHAFVRAKRITLKLIATPMRGQPDFEVAYTLADADEAVTVTTTFTNHGDAPVEADVVDTIRADRTFDRVADGPAETFWVYDKHFRQAYGVVAEGRGLAAEAGATRLRYPDGKNRVVVGLKPGESSKLVRRVFPARDLFEIRRINCQLAGRTCITRDVHVVGPMYNYVGFVDVIHEVDGKPVAWSRGDDQHEGPVRVTIEEPRGQLIIKTQSYQQKKPFNLAEFEAYTMLREQLELTGGQVNLIVRDEAGQPIPFKAQYVGVGGTPSPDFGPEGGEHWVRNVYYGFRDEGRKDYGVYHWLPAGTYDVIISHGPEYDAITERITVGPGNLNKVERKLKRTVDTQGWISSDFHSHSSPSGDNTSSQYGRVLNLLCEQIEFAPCTEHNRLSTYDPHVKRLKAERFMATCVGMELTGTPLPLNHQNAFPLIMQPHTQDGGGPITDADPETQIERLALWDGGAEKLVQVNHPDMGWMFFDRNGDGGFDQGFANMAGRMDVIEVHPPHFIFNAPTHENGGKTYNNTMHNWLQLLNQGRRVPGVVNTDAHYNFHGSGWLRNYVKSPTDDPAEIKTLDVVHEAERGHIVMTSGPFLEVTLRPDGSSQDAIPGDTVMAKGGKATLHVRVQCPNWFDVNRVQVFVNGKAVESLNFTRKAAPERFSSQTVKFDQTIPLELPSDAHVIVATIGEGSKLGPVMGPDHGNDPPVAVSNPIYVDVDGDGFKANGDPLGGLPTKGGR